MSNFLDRVVDLAIRQRNSLINILFDSQCYMIGMLWFVVSLFMFSGTDGNFNPVLWIIALYTIYRIFRNAINASEAGL